MNIPQDTLQAVADAAFNSTSFGSLITRASHIDFPHQGSIRRAVIQHALSNPALAPFLAGGIGEYTDEELEASWTDAILNGGPIFARLRAFLAALPDRPQAQPAWIPHDGGPCPLKDEEVDEWQVKMHNCEGYASISLYKNLPPSQASGWEKSIFAYRVLKWKPSPCRGHAATGASRPSTQVPLGPEDCPPCSLIRNKEGIQYMVQFSDPAQMRFSARTTVGLDALGFRAAMDDGWQINTSIPDTGRWDANAWRPCSKPAGKEVAK